MTSRPTGRTAPSVTFVLEEHLGHLTYAQNLRRSLEARDDLRSRWVPVRYEQLAGPLGRLPIPARLAGFLAGRDEVRRGLAHDESDIRVFNTQVPAAIGGRRARRRPYVVITDVTPVQYDAMAEGYGHVADGNGLTARWKHHVNQAVFRGADACIPWSTWAARSIVDDYRVDPERVVVIPPGVDTGTWRPLPTDGDEGFRIMFVGGDFDRKGGADLLAAFATLPPDSELVLVTKSNIPSSERVRVVDDLGPNDPRLIQLMATCDVFALPSRAETFGIAAGEASASGLPVVATDVGGLPDIVVDGVTGYVVGVGDRDRLAGALAELHDDLPRRRRFAQAARQHAVEHFDAERNAGRMSSMLLELVRNDRA